MRTILLLLVLQTLVFSKTVVDHYNNKVELPDHITKIYAATPPLTMALLAFDPNLVAALNSPFNDEQKEYVGVAAKKEVVGGFMGQGNTPNLEMLANIKPDVILLWGGATGIDNIVKKLKTLNIPILLLKNDTIYDLLAQFETFGELSGNKARANELIEYTKKSLSLLNSYEKKIQKPTRYYFAESLDGLSSECNGSFHLEPFGYAGGVNALHCTMSSNFGMEKISMENIMLSDPDVIVAMESEFYKNIKHDSRFKNLKAVQNNQIYLVPSTPFNYITRPPSFMRLLGIRWLIDSFYPQLINESFDEQKAEFEKIFFPQKKVE